MKQYVRILIGSCLLAFGSWLSATAQSAVRIDASKTHQRITGFGGFVCSPQFQYNHMSTAEINKVWGKSSTVGCNIMRLYIPIGKSNWSQSLATAKAAKQLGLIVFASPWGQPAEWKTNNSINARTSDGKDGKLKAENWADYAQYLEDYVQYLRKNGVELDAISIQNEPDWPATYAGCLWSATEIANFVKTYGKSISCKVMAPETLAVSDGYANALNKDDVLECFDIYGGHQYGGIQSAYRNLGKKGKELWMTEYLINWNENKSDSEKRNYDFSKDFFDFFRAINTCMLGDFNAWIHYAVKRYYGLMGDGTTGAGSSGTITKRGYIMAHFAKYVTGMTRVDIDFGQTGLEGSAYLSQSGDTVVAVMANTADTDVSMMLDLPFYTQAGSICTTGKASCFQKKTLTVEETCRPGLSVPSQSVATLLFVRSRDRQQSDMTGSALRFDRLDDMATTKSTFGTTYRMSGNTRTFDHENALISSRSNAANGYISLDNRYAQLVMNVKKVTSTLNLSSAKTTLVYVNGSGQVSTHDYGDLDLSKGQDFNLVFDLSPATLADGCKGIISMTNNNWSSKLSITFGDVWLASGSMLYAATLGGAFVADDSHVLDYLGDAACTSIDMTKVTDLPGQLPWTPGNRVAYLPSGSNAGQNVVADGVCKSLVLTADGGDFRPAASFNAQQVSLTLGVDGCRMVMVPFDAAIPEGVKAYAIDQDLNISPLSSITAHTPCLLQSQGDVTLTGSGTVGYGISPLDAPFRGTYTAAPLFAGDYVLAQQDGKWGFRRLTSPATLMPFDVYAQLQSSTAFIPIVGDVSGISSVLTDGGTRTNALYDLQGRRVQNPTRGLYIRNGRKVLMK